MEHLRHGLFAYSSPRSCPSFSFHMIYCQGCVVPSPCLLQAASNLGCELCLSTLFCFIWGFALPPSMELQERHMETKLIFEGPSYTLPWWSCSNCRDVRWCDPQLSLEHAILRYHFRPFETGSFIHQPYFFAERKTHFFWTCIKCFCSVFCSQALREPRGQPEFPDRRSSTSGDQSILGSTVSAAHGGDVRFLKIMKEMSSCVFCFRHLWDV